MTAEGLHFITPPERPFVPGNECVGLLPSGERRFFPVTSIVAPHGTMAEFALARPYHGLNVPDDVPSSLAAALGNAGLAAWLPLSWRAEMQPGESVLILGATGTTGLIAAAAARLLGAGRTITLTSADQHEPSLRALADAGGIDICLDYLNGPATELVLAAMKPGGRLVQIGSPLGSSMTVATQLMRQKSLSLLGFAYFLAPKELQQSAYDSLCMAAMKSRNSIDYHEVALSDIKLVWTHQKAGNQPRQVIIP